MADQKNSSEVKNGRRSRGATPNDFSDDSSGEDSDHGMSMTSPLLISFIT